ncbi:MAG TPA: hypothetical protein VHN80_06970 [Kineosporiaceae bacterium]|nr:hypothetical protein [Kineosporiaceae bacterium]
MSAPTALEAGALLRGLAWRVRSHPQSASIHLDAERRANDALAALTRDHDLLCRQACDPLEIAAVLETAGIDDRRARGDFQSAGVFEVAEQMWQLVPWRPATDGSRVDPWRLPLWRAQLRGLLYALPALLASAVLGQIGAGPGHVLLFAATAASIALGQALSVLGHVLAGRGQRRAVATLGRGALIGALVVTVLLTATLVLTGGQLRLGLLSGGQLLFVVSATMLMINGSDRLLLGVIAPGVTMVGLEFAGVPIAALIGLPPVALLLGAPAITVLACAACAWLRMRAATEGEPLRRALGRPELSVAATAAGYGIGLSALVSFAVLAIASGRVGEPSGRIVAATLPLTATFGIAEYLLHRARGRSVAGLGRARLVTGFARRSLGELRAMVALHAIAVAVVGALVVLVAGGGRLDPALIGYTASYAVLSVTLLLCTTLMSFGYVSLAAWQACGGAAVLLLVGALAPLRNAALVDLQLGVLTVLLLIAYRLTAVRFKTASAHR